MKRFTYLIVILLLSATGFAQGHFIVAFTGYGQDHMNIKVVTATVQGMALEAGDEIAVFDGNICCSKVVLTKPIVVSDKSTFAALAASRKDNGLENGYTVGNDISYKFWDKSMSKEIDGITAEYQNPATGQPTAAPTFTVNGSAFVKLSVSVPVNQAPVANAGPDQSVNEGATVLLDGSASSDPDGNPLTYKWTAPAGITLSSATVQKPTFTAPEVTINTSYTISLVVNDGLADSPADQVVITVKNLINGIPVANAGPDQSVNEGATVLLDGSASSDPDGNPLTYKWIAPAGITLSSATVQKPTFTAPEVTINTSYTINLMVNDGLADSPADQVVITVKNGINGIPVANAGPDQSVNEGATVSLDGSASTDPDGNPLTYKWTAPTGITLSSVTDQKPTFTAPEVTINTSYTISLVVNDGLADSPADQVVITVKNGINGIPVANAGPDQYVNEGVLVTLDGTASSDPDGNPLTYLWTAPAGITLSSATTQKPTFTAPNVSSDIKYTFSLVVNDGFADSPKDQVVITVKQTDQVPVANAGPDQSVFEGDLVTLDGSASSTPGDCPVNYQWPCPVEMGIGKTYVTRITFTGHEVIPTTDHTITLEIEDGSAASVPANGPKFQWVIPAGVTLSPKIIAKVTIVTPVNTADKKCIFSLVVFDGSNSVEPGNGIITYVSIPPSEIPLVSVTLIKLSVTSPEPSTAVAYKFSMLVYDGSGSATPENGAMTYFFIQPTDINLSSPTVAKLTITSPDGPTDPNYDFSLIICNGSDSPDAGNGSLTYRWIAPPGITLSSETDSKPTFIAPQVDVDTDYTFSLMVNNGKADSPPDLVVITVKHINKAPTANAGADQSVPKGASVTLDGSASSDPEGNALTYLWTAPGGINLSSNTDSKPTFTAPNVAVDTEYTFLLVVRDGKLDSPADQVAVLIRKENQAPTAIAGPDQSVNDGSLVYFDGSASSDPDGDALTYKWIAPVGITLSSETNAKPTFAAPQVSTDTKYTFSLVVNDGLTDSPADEVIVTVRNVDHAPYVKNPIQDISVNKAAPDQIIDLKTVFADDDFGDVLVYSLTSNTNELAVEATITGSDLTLNFSDLNIGSSEIVITASSNGKEVNSKFTVEINIATVINKLSEDAEVEIYPNPTIGLVQIKFNHQPTSGSRIKVYDITGKIIYMSQTLNKTESLNLTGKPKGLYFIKIDQKIPKTYKLIITE